MAKTTVPTNQILLFPSHGQRFDQNPNKDLQIMNQSQSFHVVLSGTYRKDFQGLRRAYEELIDLGCEVLSPLNVSAVKEVDGFVYMKGEEAVSPESIEARHLNAILAAQFVWLHAPNGYVGPTAALEVGFAKACGIPVYCQEKPADPALHHLVATVDSLSSVLRDLQTHSFPLHPPALRAVQNYYRRVAVRRGYERETARDCMLLMVEEVGELARSIRQEMRLTRHGKLTTSSQGLEVADVLLYVIHMANILNVDLPLVLHQKEMLNEERFKIKGM
jgi:NTP pyrophosphatase (non-canonical NTP hydrolase)